MRVAWIPLFVACVCVPSAAQTSEDDWQRHPDGTLSVRLEGAPLAETLLRVAGFGGLEVVFDAQALADRRVSARFERKTPEQVWRLLITSQNLRDRLADGVHCVEVPDTDPGLPLSPDDEDPADPSPVDPVPVDPVPVDPGPEEPVGPLEGSLTSEVPFEGAPAPEQAVVLSVDVGVTALYRFDVDGPMGRMRLEDQGGAQSGRDGGRFAAASPASGVVSAVGGGSGRRRAALHVDLGAGHASAGLRPGSPGWAAVGGGGDGGPAVDRVVLVAGATSRGGFVHFGDGGERLRHGALAGDVERGAGGGG